MTQYDLLRLPWEIQLALASGYAAYVVAYTGLRDRQRTIDVAFISLVFSLIATLISATSAPHVGPVVASSLAFVGTVLVGALWRRFGRGAVLSVLRRADVTWSDDEPSALTTLSGNTQHRVSQVAVLVDDGTWLSCNDTSEFAAAPFGPYLWGPNGDLAIYVTESTLPSGEVKQQTTVKDAGYGDRITYIPAGRIKQITFRHMPKSSRSLPAVAEPSALSQPARAEL